VLHFIFKMATPKEVDSNGVDVADGAEKNPNPATNGNAIPSGAHLN